MDARNPDTTSFEIPKHVGVGALRVLLVDDDEGLRRALTRVLEGAHHSVRTAEDGAAAVKALAEESFDVVVSDIQMPGMSGVDLLHVVRSYDLDVPVVLMTGDPSLDTAAAAVEYGALRYLIKPVAHDQLKSIVAHAGRVRRLAAVKRAMLSTLGSPVARPADRAGLDSAFNRALTGMHLAFQPIVDARTQRVVAYEALMRSAEPSLPDPGAVLEAAEQLGRVHDVGRRVRSLACEARSRMDPEVLLFVNLHSQDLLDAQLAAPGSPLQRMADRVVLEITERCSLEGVSDVRGRVARLRELGFRIAVDDLGAGYAGLSSFAALEPEFVKLDMSLTRAVDTSPVRQRLIKSMTTLCSDLGTRIIVEGIETPEERDTLLRLGCDTLQGYLFARPGPPFPQPQW
jgi:EAL domain-containing protein (putative c-di-GMP-specific phosphodiesterase class I)